MLQASMRLHLKGILLAVGLCLIPGLVKAQATLLSEYRFDDGAWCSPVSALDTVGGRNGSLISSVVWEDSPASGVKPVNGAAARFAGGAIDITGMPFDLTPGAKNSVSFWMFWDGTNSVMPIGFQAHDLWIQGGSFGFNTFNGDIFGISSAGLASGWHHVAAVFTNGNVTGNRIWIDGVAQILTQRMGTPNNGNAVINSHMRISGVWGNSGYKFQGALDAVRVYQGEMTQAQVDADRTAAYATVVCPPPPPAVLLSEYRFDDIAWCTPTIALDTASVRNGTLVGSVGWEDSPASGGKPVSGAAARFAGTGAIDITGVPFDLSAGGRNSVSFWMFWDGTNSVMPLGFANYDLWLQGGSFGFNTFSSDIYGIASAGLASGWHHVAAVFTNGGVSGNKIWIDGVAQTLTQRTGTPNAGNAIASSHMRLSGVWGSAGYMFTGFLDGVRLYSGVITQAQVDADRAATFPLVVCPPPPPPTLVAHFRLDDNWDVTHAAANEVGGGPAAVVLSPYATKVVAPAVPPKPDTCFGAQFSTATGSMRTTGVSLDLNGGGKNSVSFWMLWNGGNSQMPFGFALHDLWLIGSDFGFNTANSDVFGIDSTGLASGWHHVAAVFTNGNVAANKLWIDGVPRALSQRRGTPNNTNAYAANTFQLSSWTNNNGYRFDGSLDELKVYRGELTDALVLVDYAASCVSAAPSNFNAVELGADPATGRIYTKLGGVLFDLDIAALKADNTLETGFSGNVAIDLLANINTGVPLSANNCPTSQDATISLGNAAFSGGRATVSNINIANAYRDVRMRFTCSAAVCGSAITACSSDNFAVRPQSFTITANLGGATLKAGNNFTMTAATTVPAGYTGTPVLNTALVQDHNNLAPPGLLNGSFAAATGSSATGTFQYHDVGTIAPRANAVTDSAYTTVDQANADCVVGDTSYTLAGGKYGCNIGSIAAGPFGRFYPDHFTYAATLTPACAGGLTYMDQPALGITLTLTAQSAAPLNATTTRYTAGYSPLGTFSITGDNAGAAVAVARLLQPPGLPGLPTFAWNNGVYTVTGNWSFTRNATPDGPYDSFALLAAVTDPDGATLTGTNTSNTTIVRFGRLHMLNAHGSELRSLPLNVVAQFYNGTGFATNTLDSCTSISLGNVMLNGWQRNLSACETGLSGGGTLASGELPNSMLLRLGQPGAGNDGSVDLTIRLGPSGASDATCSDTLPVGPPYTASGVTSTGATWLQWPVSSDPTARATFGIYRDRLIFRREITR